MVSATNWSSARMSPEALERWKKRVAALEKKEKELRDAEKNGSERRNGDSE